MTPKEWADLLPSIASVLWPVLAIVLACVIAPHLLRMLRQAREITLEVGGQKISLQLASEELRRQIVDLQEKAAQLEAAESSQSDQLEDGRMAHDSTTAAEGDRSKPGSSLQRILWVDDRPDANVYEKAALADLGGVQIRTAASTREGLRALKLSDFDVVISDIHRMENEREIPDAGLQFARRVREQGYEVPIVFYSSHRSIERYADEIDELGAQATSSPTELLALLSFVTDPGLGRRS